MSGRTRAQKKGDLTPKVYSPRAFSWEGWEGSTQKVQPVRWVLRAKINSVDQSGQVKFGSREVRARKG